MLEEKAPYFVSVVTIVVVTIVVVTIVVSSRRSLTSVIVCRCSQCPTKLMFQKTSGTTRGRSEKLQTQRATGDRHHFSTRVVTMLNSLSDDTVQARTVTN